ncbi:phage protein Gp36 family protein, partial [Riemerella anatipestifer]
MYIEIEELKTHCHEEELKAIIQGDETIALACIDMAIEFASTKLMKDYDVNEIFAKTGNERSPLLVKIIKDIAVWEIIGLENPSVDYQDKKFRYEQAVNWLNAVYKGMPANLPKLEETEDKVKAFSY